MSYRKLGRTSSQRKALLRDLTTDLIVNGSIKTTEARAKEVRKTADKMITLAKRGDLAMLMMSGVRPQVWKAQNLPVRHMPA